MIKPILAVDINLNKVKYPVMVLPKIDGVRGLYIDRFTGRSLKPFANKHVNEVYDDLIFKGLDGELAIGNINDPELCRKTTSALSTITGCPDYNWHIFDYVTEDTVNMSYYERYHKMAEEVIFLNNPLVTFVPMNVVYNETQLLELEDDYLQQGMEGIIVRGMEGRYKSGRTTVNEGYYLRLKRFVEEDAIILFLNEAKENQNEKQTNELGNSFRSSHKDGKIGKDTLGSIVALDVKTNKEILIGPGTLDHVERKYIWDNWHSYIGKQFKYKSFPKGVKDKPRFPTFANWRIDSDK